MFSRYWKSHNKHQIRPRTWKSHNKHQVREQNNTTLHTTSPLPPPPPPTRDPRLSTRASAEGRPQGGTEAVVKGTPPLLRKIFQDLSAGFVCGCVFILRVRHCFWESNGKSEGSPKKTHLNRLRSVRDPLFRGNIDLQEQPTTSQLSGRLGFRFCQAKVTRQKPTFQSTSCSFIVRSQRRSLKQNEGLVKDRAGRFRLLDVSKYVPSR